MRSRKQAPVGIFFFSFSFVEIQNALVYKKKIKKNFSGEVDWVHQALNGVNVREGNVIIKPSLKE